MLTRVTAEFESADLAEIACKRIKESVNGIKRTGIIYNKNANTVEKLTHGYKFTLLPTAITTHNYFTALMESETTPDILSEIKQRTNAYLYIICEKSMSTNVASLMNSFGGTMVKVSKS